MAKGDSLQVWKNSQQFFLLIRCTTSGKFSSFITWKKLSQKTDAHGRKIERQRKFLTLWLGNNRSKL